MEHSSKAVKDTQGQGLENLCLNVPCITGIDGKSTKLLRIKYNMRMLSCFCRCVVRSSDTFL